MTAPITRKILGDKSRGEGLIALEVFPYSLNQVFAITQEVPRLAPDTQPFRHRSCVLSINPKRTRKAPGSFESIRMCVAIAPLKLLDE